MLIVNAYALGFINAEHLLHNIPLCSLGAQNPQNIVGVQGTFSQTAANFHSIAFLNRKLGAVRNDVGLLHHFIFRTPCNDDLALFLAGFFHNVDRSRIFCQNTRMLGLAGFKQFLNTGQTLGNIFRTGNTARMEGTHGQLGTRFTDSLRGNGADSFAHVNIMVCCQVTAVAFAAYTEFGFTGQYRTDLDFIAHHSNLICHIFRNIIIDVEQHIAFRIFDIFRQRPADDTVMQ